MITKLDVGEGYYITYRYVANGWGGSHAVNITVNRYDDEWYYYEVNDKYGCFHDFPGFEPGKWQADIEEGYADAVRFGFGMTDFVDGKSVTCWMVQPNGIYLDDEYGFGAEDFREIVVYSVMDATGHFLIPFTEEKIATNKIIQWLE